MYLRKELVSVGLLATVVAATVPQVAWAADETTTLVGIIQNIGTSVNDVISAVFLGVAGVIFACALLAIIIEAVKMIFSTDKVQSRQHIATGLKVLGVCMLAGVSVLLVNGAINLFSSGINFGSITGLTPAQ